MLRIFSFSLLLLASPALLAQPAWKNKKPHTALVKKSHRTGKSKQTQAKPSSPKKVKTGQFIWRGNAVKGGAMWAKISLPEQKLYLYRKGVLIGVSSVSTGKSGYRTPTGRFKVRGKTLLHHSRKYDNAPMPYTHWLTSKGVAMHAGRVPGYPASHGCIRLPRQFARLLYENSPVGMPVIITQQSNKTASVHTYSKRKLPTLTSLENPFDDELLALLTY